MARKKTRKKTRKAPAKRKPAGTRARRNANGAFFTRASAALIVLIARAIRAVTPSPETVNKIAAAAWRSRGVRRTAGLVAGAVVLVGLSWIMLSNLRDDERYMVDPGRIELAEGPSWAKDSLSRRMKHEIEEELRADLADLPQASAFDEGVMREIEQRLKANPWIRRVLRIERRFPTGPGEHSRLLPVLEMRMPAIAVMKESRYVLVDGESVVLPLELPVEGNKFKEFNSQLKSPLRVVRGVDARPPIVGKTWNSEQINAAISMERVIRRAELDRYPGIETIVLVGVPGRADPRGRVHYQHDGGVVLIPNQSLMPGTRLFWGRPPVHASSLEPSPNDKLDRLRARLRNMESVAEQRIDLRHSG